MIVEKYQPKKFKDLTLHPEIDKRLRELSNDQNILICGPPGSGKKTRVDAILEKIYGEEALQTRCQTHEFVREVTKVKKKTGEKKKTSLKLKVLIVSSNYHIEYTPSNLGSRDKFLINEISKIASNSKVACDSLNDDVKLRKVIVIHQVDKMSLLAQQALRRTVEKYYKATCFIFVAENRSKISDALISRCLFFRIPSPEITQIANLLNNIIEEEKITCLDFEDVIQIASSSDRNVSKALLLLTLGGTSFTSPLNPLLANGSSYVNDVKSSGAASNISSGTASNISSGAASNISSGAASDRLIEELATKISFEQNPKMIPYVEKMISSLINTNISPSIIIKSIAKSLCSKVMDSEEKLSNKMKFRIIELAAKYEYAMIDSKPSIHLEAFIVHFMTEYQEYVSLLF
jgi:replication factor C subunit 3/5